MPLGFLCAAALEPMIFGASLYWSLCGVLLSVFSACFLIGTAGMDGRVTQAAVWSQNRPRQGVDPTLNEQIER